MKAAGQRHVFTMRGNPHFYNMHETNLEHLLRESLNKVFVDSFVQFCTHEASSHTYPKENLFASRMYLHYLKASIEALPSMPPALKEAALKEDYPEDRGEASKKVVRLSSELLAENPEAPSDPDMVTKALTVYCYGATEKNKKDANYYHTLFVQSWLEYFSMER